MTLRERVWRLIEAEQRAMTTAEIAERLGEKSIRISNAVGKLRDRKLLTTTGGGHQRRYAVCGHFVPDPRKDKALQAGAPIPCALAESWGWMAQQNRGA